MRIVVRSIAHRTGVVLLKDSMANEDTVIQVLWKVFIDLYKTFSKIWTRTVLVRKRKRKGT